MLDSKQIMQLALDMVGFETIPPDSKILLPGRGMKRVLFGIDIGVPELLLAKELGVDGVIAHHPIAIGTFPKILEKHVDQMAVFGIPHEVGEKAIAPIKEGYDLSFLAGNFDHVVSVAKLLGLPLMCIHNPLDEVGRRIMDQAIVERRKVVEGAGGTFTVGDVVEALKAIPEFGRVPTHPQVMVGKAENPAGQVVVAHAAGTNGRYGVANAYFEHGVSTVVYIHVDGPGLAKLRAENKGNLVVSGHIVADAVGINPFVELLRKNGMEVITISGCGL